jgi:F0F1-type ATP synthase assembly protein I
MLLKDREIKRIFTKVITYSSAYILIPLVVLGMVGYIIDKKLDTAPKFLLIGVGFAFVFSNILLFKKRSFLSKKIKSEVDKITNS